MRTFILPLGITILLAGCDPWVQVGPTAHGKFRSLMGCNEAAQNVYPTPANPGAPLLIFGAIGGAAAGLTQASVDTHAEDRDAWIKQCMLAKGWVQK